MFEGPVQHSAPPLPGECPFLASDKPHTKQLDYSCFQWQLDWPVLYLHQLTGFILPTARHRRSISTLRVMVWKAQLGEGPPPPIPDKQSHVQAQPLHQGLLSIHRVSCFSLCQLQLQERQFILKRSFVCLCQHLSANMLSCISWLEMGLHVVAELGLPSRSSSLG